MNRNITFYISAIVVFGFLLWYFLSKGSIEEKLIKAKYKISYINKPGVSPSPENTITNNPVIPKQSITEKNIFKSFYLSLKMNMKRSISMLIIQIIIIIIISRIFGYFFGLIKIPIVIGEILAGIFLGPSILGTFLPHLSSILFPLSSLPNLQLISQLGLILFMFVIGMELDLKIIKTKLNSAIVVSHSTILFQFFIGVLFSYLVLFGKYSPPNVKFISFALFIGIALSITAFPVLARIIHEKGLTKTTRGIMAITCAATDDITAWLLLALIITFVQAGTPLGALYTCAITIIYIIGMIYFIHPLMRRIGRVYFSAENLNKNVIAFIFVLLFFSSLFTEVIGINALFGAFIAGLVIPDLKIKKLMAQKIEDISIVVFLPLFFVYTGLRTQIGLLNSHELLMDCLLVVFLAIAGKFGGAALLSRFIGRCSWSDSFSIGALMNTRGLMELIVLNIGYDMGILSPEIFTIFVIMALTTTFMTGPLLSLIDYLRHKFYKPVEIPVVEIKEETPAFKVIISFGPATSGASLLKLLYSLYNFKLNKFKIWALHLTPHTEILGTSALDYEAKSFALIKAASEELKLDYEPIYKTTDDVSKEVIRSVKEIQCDLLFMGAAQSVFTNDILGGKVREILEGVKCNVGVVINKNIQKLNNVLIISNLENCDRVIKIFSMLLKYNPKLTLMNVESENDNNVQKLEVFNKNPYYSDIRIISRKFFDTAFINDFDLVILEYKFCEKDFTQKNLIVEEGPSLLIVKLKE
ncbi:MAG: cation:proton antiporter [Bacteroidota bacterium]|nr:cation:proton antiporter [Bacteroidota bacterium]